MNAQENQAVENPIQTAINTLYGKREITLEGWDKPVAIHKIQVVHFGEITSILNKIIAELGVDGRGNVTVDLGNSVALLQLIAKLPDEANKVLCLLTSLKKSEVDSLDLAEALELFTAVIEVNKRFFTEKVKPQLDAFLKTIGLYLEKQTS